MLLTTLRVRVQTTQGVWLLLKG
ncbi:MAG: hypothetical protein ACD_7C00463G0003, partial [uncultured bacterium]